MEKNFKMIIAGGKTGGHLFPGIAIAQAVLRIKSGSEILFVGTGEPFETKTLSRYGFNHKRITSAGIKGKGLFEKIKALIKIPLSIIQAVIIIMQFKPDIVVGVGGFSSGAVVLGARLCGVLTAIQEQNSIAGITNRILEHFAHVIFTTFKETKGLTKHDKMILTGNPIRKSDSNISTIDIDTDKQDTNLNSSTDSNVDADTDINIDSDIKTDNDKSDSSRFTLLVTGGSQGAKSINSAFIDAVKLMKYDEKYLIIHQTGDKDHERVFNQYKEILKKHKNDHNSHNNKEIIDNLVNNIIAKPFFNDLPAIQASADFIICRAGAGTIAEITALGKPVLFIPYPYAADDHQTYNAKALADKGAAWLIPDSGLSGGILKEKIEFAFNNREELKQMGEKAKEFGNPMADEMIASICVDMAEKFKLIRLNQAQANKSKDHS